MTIYLLVGCPASGKSWVCSQLQGEFTYVPHDENRRSGQGEDDYLETILSFAEDSPKPILIETPFGVNQIRKTLEDQGHDVVPVFIIEDPDVVSQRYLEREGREIPKGHLTRQETYRERAFQWGSFYGTSGEVLEYLRNEI